MNEHDISPWTRPTEPDTSAGAPEGWPPSDASHAAETDAPVDGETYRTGTGDSATLTPYASYEDGGETLTFDDGGQTDGGSPPSTPDAAAIAGPGAVPESGAASRASVWKEELVAWFKTLVSAAVYATLIVTFGFQVARVEGQSMAPTLSDQDRLIVNKLAYRLGPPRRGDIVMLYYPLNPDKSFVKRVIAEEGDTVKIEDGRVYVNDVPMADDYVPPEYRSHEDQPPMVIREGYYFVMGDHRNNSSDSRHWGEVPKKYIIGRVQLRWWPIPEARVF